MTILTSPSKLHIHLVGTAMMISPFVTCLIVFAIVFGSALAGMRLRAFVPEQHLSSESRGVIQLGMGLVGTLAAMVLGLLIASAKSSYDTQSTELTQGAANVILLDRVLALYGPETKEIRETLREIVVRVMDATWSQERNQASQFGGAVSGNDSLYAQIQSLSPKSDLQRTLQSQALDMTFNLGHTRWLMYEQGATSVSRPMVVVMVFWLAIIFISWGLFAPTNVTVVATFFVVALSVSGAMLLILEMYSPYTGLIQISSAPLRDALVHLGQ